MKKNLREQITLTITDSKEGENTGVCNSTTTVSAENWTELQRMMQLAGIDMVDSETADGKEVIVDEPEDDEAEIGCCEVCSENGCDGCNDECQCVDGNCCCSGEEDYVEPRKGWVQNQVNTGSVDFSSRGPEDMMDMNFSTSDKSLGESQTVDDFDFGHVTPQTRRIKMQSYKDSTYTGRPESTGIKKSGGFPRADGYEELGEEDFASVNQHSTSEFEEFDDNNLTDSDKAEIYYDWKNGVSGDLTMDQFSELHNISVNMLMQILDEYEGGSGIATEGRLKESIAILLENDSDDFMSALDKVRDNEVHNLNESEITQLAAAFVNMVRETNTGRVQKLQECLQEYVNGGLNGEYEKFIEEESSPKKKVTKEAWGFPYGSIESSATYDMTDADADYEKQDNYDIADLVRKGFTSGTKPFKWQLVIDGEQSSEVMDKIARWIEQGFRKGNSQLPWQLYKSTTDYRYFADQKNNVTEAKKSHVVIGTGSKSFAVKAKKKGKEEHIEIRANSEASAMQTAKKSGYTIVSMEEMK